MFHQKNIIWCDIWFSIMLHDMIWYSAIYDWSSWHAKTFSWHQRKHVRANELEHLRARSQLLTSSEDYAMPSLEKYPRGGDKSVSLMEMDVDVYIPHDGVPENMGLYASWDPAEIQLSMAREISIESSRHRLESTIDKCRWPLVRGKRALNPWGLHLAGSWSKAIGNISQRCVWCTCMILPSCTQIIYIYLFHIWYTLRMHTYVYIHICGCGSKLEGP